MPTSKAISIATIVFADIDWWCGFDIRDPFRRGFVLRTSESRDYRSVILSEKRKPLFGQDHARLRR